MMSTPLKEQLVEYFRTEPIEAAYLFGSLVHGKITKESDADIAVLVARRLTRQQRFALRLALMRRCAHLLQRNVDIILLNDATSALLQYSIMKEGVLLYERSEEDRVSFELNAMNNYFDLLPFFTAYNAQYVKACR